MRARIGLDRPRSGHFSGRDGVDEPVGPRRQRRCPDDGHPGPMTGPLEAALRARRAEGRKVLVPYITGGLAGWQEAVRAIAAAGADAIEIGLPFSDPVMDGPVIQQASQMALEAGATPVSILHEARELDAGIPLAVMMYYNTVHHAGHQRFAHQLAAAGIAASLVPDLPLEESAPWCAAADAAGGETGAGARGRRRGRGRNGDVRRADAPRQPPAVDRGARSWVRVLRRTPRCH